MQIENKKREDRKTKIDISNQSVRARRNINWEQNRV